MFFYHILITVIIFTLLFNVNNGISNDDLYNIGVGIGDITGPASDINMMGYAKNGQDTAGIHFRLYSRTVIVADSKGSRICYVTCDTAMISQIVTLEVIKILKIKYNGLYNENNVLLSATHTHSGPGGFLQYVLYIITAQGFIPQTFDAIVAGIVRSIDRAHESMTLGYIYWNSGELLDTSINRSPTAYANNPEEEKAKYKHDTDKEMTILKFTDKNGKPLAMINWYAVHATSMNNTNRLISGDNKGYASMLFEQDINGGTINGKGPFVALFSQSNEGDVSPNIKGPHCLDTGLECDIATSTCNGQNEKCVAFGPGNDMFESTKIIGYRQYAKAKELFDSAKNKVSGPVQSIHQYIDMSNVVILMPDNTTASTCKPSMGYSFAAGTIDGPGAFNFEQGDTATSPFWNLVRDFLRRPSQHLTKCQYPKPILIATGEMNFPYFWQPSIVSTQILKIGNFAIVAVPAEFTTMSGRRVRDSVKSEFNRLLPDNDINVALTGLANGYSSYVTTYEEYQVQRYEAASTLFGPHTLNAYIHQFQMLASHLATGQSVAPGPQPPNLLHQQISLKPGVIFDGAPFGHRFGDVIYDAKPEYTSKSTVVVSFVSGSLRNDLQLEGTFLSIERFDNGTAQWHLIATDANWETKLFWQRTNTFFGESQATVLWEIPEKIQQGYYRIRHFGHSKNLMQHIKPYVGESRTFRIISKSYT